MALTLDWKEVRFWTRNTEHPDSVRVSEPVEPGTLVAPSGTDDELYEPGNGDGCALAITRGLSARRTIAAVRRGEVDLGAGIQDLNDGAGIFATAAGVLTDVATGSKRIGTVRTDTGRRLVRLEM